LVQETAPIKESVVASSSGDGAKQEDLDLFYEEVRRQHLTPLWKADTARRAAATVPYIWKWADFKPLLYRAAEIVPMSMADRRVLVMVNPGLAPEPAAAQTLLANLQIINPGDVAKSHRHTAAALRLVLEGQGAYTAVDGEKSWMDPGDFITTPNWTWHDHGNEGDVPMVWLDGLDVPFVNMLEANFWEQYTEPKFPIEAPDDMSMRLYSSGALRPTWVKHDKSYSPLLNYKYEETYRVLKGLTEDTDGSPFDGISVEYTNPLTGGPALPTIACFAQLLLPGQTTKAHRHTGVTIYHVIKGKGHTVINGTRFDWEEKDTFVVPSWAWHEHVGELESVVFSYSDSAVLQAVGLYREEEYTQTGGYQKIEGNFEPLPVS
jgi:gentisate 1,2-dioxygenase